MITRLLQYYFISGMLKFLIHIYFKLCIALSLYILYIASCVVYGLGTKLFKLTNKFLKHAGKCWWLQTSQIKVLCSQSMFAKINNQSGECIFLEEPNRAIFRKASNQSHFQGNDNL